MSPLHQLTHMDVFLFDGEVSRYLTGRTTDRGICEIFTISTGEGVDSLLLHVQGINRQI